MDRDRYTWRHENIDGSMFLFALIREQQLICSLHQLFIFSCSDALNDLEKERKGDAVDGQRERWTKTFAGRQVDGQTDRYADGWSA